VARSAEAPLRIEDREELIFVLSEAAELEHSLTCAYLFAAWSLKIDDDEGLTPEQLAAVRRWERVLVGVAVQEMSHLACACNLLSSLGGAPHLARPNLPQRTRYYPESIQLSFERFDLPTLDHFIHIERPEEMAAIDAPAPPPPRDAVPWHAPGRMIPGGQQYATVGHLYRGIAAGFRRLVDRFGEEAVFIGPVRVQSLKDMFGFDELIPIRDLASALQAIETIVEEGEGSSGRYEDSHYGRFLDVREDYRRLLAADPDFVPARAVLSNPFVRQPFDCDPVNLLSDPFTIRVAELGNACYTTMLQILTRCFARASEVDRQLQVLAGAGVRAMFQLLAPLGRLLTRLPAGPNHPGLTAGMSFEVYRSLHLLPHRQPAWALIRERLTELAAHADDIARDAPDEASGTVLDTVADALRRLAGTLSADVAAEGP
jgi:hypothetical protein